MGAARATMYDTFRSPEDRSLRRLPGLVRETVPLAGIDLALVRDWVEESYRSVAPRRLVAELDARRR